VLHEPLALSAQILSCVPDRQRTLRELSVGKTLVKEGDMCAPCQLRCRCLCSKTLNQKASGLGAARCSVGCWRWHAAIILEKANLCTCRWLIKHGAADYKTGRSYGERPPLVLAHHLNGELEAWIDTWRAKLGPQHDFLFTRRGRALARSLT
jgi:hypothetical protein